MASVDRIREQFISRIKEQFISEGYQELSTSKLDKLLDWQPDLMFSNNGCTYPVLFKSNNSIPPTFLVLIANVPSEKIIPIIVFAQRIKKKSDVKIILEYGIGIGYFIGGKLSDIILKKKTTKQTLKKEIKKKLEHIDIFVSSKQNGIDGIELKERTLMRKTINLLRDTRNYPFTAHLIEYDRFKLKKLYEHIDTVMKNCEWVLILLEDSYSKDVSYEIKRAIKTKMHENIFMFVKLTLTCQNTWKKEINKIEKLSSQSIKYLRYSDTSDLEVTLTKAMNERMGEICKKKRIEIFV